MHIVYTYVCGDILHEGHLLYLENAKALGDKLIVGVLTDKAVMEKKKKPIVSFRERVRLIQALVCVDSAIPQDEYSPIINVEKIQPDIVVESASHEDNEYMKELKKICKGRLVIMPYYPTTSSSEIKKKIRGE